MRAQEAVSLDAQHPNWLVSAARRKATDFQTFDYQLTQPATMLAATDGFMELKRYWASNSLDVFMEDIQSQALWVCLEQLRSIESQPGSGLRFPRSKRHDDATAALVR